MNQLYMHMNPLFFLDSFLILAITECWVELPVLYSSYLLVTYFIYSRVYMSIPVSQIQVML